MASKSERPVRPFLPEDSSRCSICRDGEVAEWIAACLNETNKLGARKPPASMVHREATAEFGERMPRHENTTREHLKNHEDMWNAWDK